MGKVTLDDLARYTSFSKATISRVLSGKSKEFRINKETSRRILEAAKELNYRPSAVAQILHNKMRCTIGLVVPDLSNLFFAGLASIITVEAQKQDCIVMLSDTQENPSTEDAVIREMQDHKVDGLIIVPCGRQADGLERASRHLPVIQVDRYFEQSKLPYVSTNNYKGAFEAMTLLLEYGHRNIACIQGPHFSITNRERIKGCRDAISQYPHQAKMHVLGNDFSTQNGYIETLFILGQPQHPTAIFTFSNTIMLGAIQAIRERHLTIPNDISLISFDDLFFIDHLNPPITRVAQPIMSIGIAAMRLMVNSIRNSAVARSNILLSPTIVMRNSIKKLS